MHTNRLAWSMAFLATLAYSTSSPIARTLFLGGMSPTAMLAARYLLATLLLAITLRFTWREQLKIDRRGLAICILAGLVNGLSTLAYFWGLSRMSASISAMLFTVYPLAVLGFLALRGERFTLRSSMRVLLGIAGVYLLVAPGGEIDMLGVVLVLLAAASFALSLVIVQWYLPGYSSMTVSYYTGVSITAVVSAFWLAGLAGDSLYDDRGHIPGALGNVQSSAGLWEFPNGALLTAGNAADHHLVDAVPARTADPYPVAGRGADHPQHAAGIFICPAACKKPGSQSPLTQKQGTGRKSQFLTHRGNPVIIIHKANRWFII